MSTYPQIQRRQHPASACSVGTRKRSLLKEFGNISQNDRGETRERTQALGVSVSAPSPEQRNHTHGVGEAGQHAGPESRDWTPAGAFLLFSEAGEERCVSTSLSQQYQQLL